MPLPPRSDHRSGEAAVLLAIEQMVGTEQWDEAVGLGCGGEQPLALFDGDDRVRWRVHDEQWHG